MLVASCAGRCRGHNKLEAEQRLKRLPSDTNYSLLKPILNSHLNNYEFHA